VAYSRGQIVLFNFIHFSVCTRMAWAMSVLFVSFTCLLALSIPDSDLWQDRFLHLVLMLIVLANVGVNVLQVVIYIFFKLKTF
jgi:hypothetical protein